MNFRSFYASIADGTTLCSTWAGAREVPGGRWIDSWHRFGTQRWYVPELGGVPLERLILMSKSPPVPFGTGGDFACPTLRVVGGNAQSLLRAPQRYYARRIQERTWAVPVAEYPAGNLEQRYLRASSIRSRISMASTNLAGIWPDASNRRVPSPTKPGFTDLLVVFLRPWSTIGNQISSSGLLRPPTPRKVMNSLKSGRTCLRCKTKASILIASSMLFARAHASARASLVSFNSEKSTPSRKLICRSPSTHRASAIRQRASSLLSSANP